MAGTEKISLIDVAYEAIRNMILKFDLIPGQTVSDFTLAKKLQMSRTPVREAILMLRRDGLIEMTEQGHIVAPINEAEIRDLYIAREAVECKAALLLIEEEKITNEFIAKLRNYNRQIEKNTAENNIHMSFEPDKAFHYAIVEETGSKRLIAQMNFYSLQNDRLRFLTLVCTGRADLVPGEHEALIRALEQRSSKKVMDAIHWHLQYTVGEYIAAIEKWPANQWVQIVKAIEVGR